MSDDELRKRIRRDLDACNAKIREAETTLQEQRVVKSTLEALLKGSAKSTKRGSKLIPKKKKPAKSAASTWQDKALEILKTETKKQEILQQLQQAGFEVTNNALGAWLTRSKAAGVLERRGQGLYVAV